MLGAYYRTTTSLHIRCLRIEFRVRSTSLLRSKARRALWISTKPIYWKQGKKVSSRCTEAPPENPLSHSNHKLQNCSSKKWRTSSFMPTDLLPGSMDLAPTTGRSLNTVSPAANLHTQTISISGRPLRPMHGKVSMLCPAHSVMFSSRLWLDEHFWRF